MVHSIQCHSTLPFLHPAVIDLTFVIHHPGEVNITFLRKVYYILREYLQTIGVDFFYQYGSLQMRFKRPILKMLIICIHNKT